MIDMRYQLTICTSSIKVNYIIGRRLSNLKSSIKIPLKIVALNAQQVSKTLVAASTSDDITKAITFLQKSKIGGKSNKIPKLSSPLLWLLEWLGHTPPTTGQEITSEINNPNKMITSSFPAEIPAYPELNETITSLSECLTIVLNYRKSLIINKLGDSTDSKTIRLTNSVSKREKLEVLKAKTSVSNNDQELRNFQLLTVPREQKEVLEYFLSAPIELTKGITTKLLFHANEQTKEVALKQTLKNKVGIHADCIPIILKYLDMNFTKPTAFNAIKSIEQKEKLTVALTKEVQKVVTLYI